MFGYNNYQPQYNPYLQQTPQQQNTGINWVMGESSAMSYPVKPGDSALLMDSEKRVFYIKTCDASGMPMPLRIFDYTQRNSVQNSGSKALDNVGCEFVKADAFAALEAKFDDLQRRIDGMEGKHESAVSRPKSNGKDAGTV